MSSWWEAESIWIDKEENDLVIKFDIPWDDNGANYLTIPLDLLKKVLNGKN